VLRIAPDNEEAHRTLMLCHARLDRRSLALRQYRALADGLARLRVAPSPGSADLYERIRRGEAV
jgi:DNA-binding SARP family transcriptional activator